jgi:hypothetical protein
MLHGWDNFYIMAGTAGATLIGLLFVIITLGTHLSPSRVAHGVRAFLTPTLVHFGSVLLQALVVLVPWPSAWPAGLVLAFCGLVGLVYLVDVVLKRQKVQFVSLHLLDWIPYAGIPALANLNLITGAIGIIAEKSFAPYCLAGAITLFLFAGIYGAWDLTLWIVKNRDAAAT